jgi:hypothetical protein
MKSAFIARKNSGIEMVMKKAMEIVSVAQSTGSHESYNSAAFR